MFTFPRISFAVLEIMLYETNSKLRFHSSLLHLNSSSVALCCRLYRHHRGRIVPKKVLGNNEYVVLYVKLNKGVKYAVGDVYYLHHQFIESTGMLPQRSHPSTTFANLSQDSTWDIGFVISIMEDEESLFFPWTNWLANDDHTCSLHTWGPYRSFVSQLSTQLIQEAEGMQSPSHYLLFATGSGCGYLLDDLSCLAYRTQPSFQCESQRNKHTKIDIFYFLSDARHFTTFCVSQSTSS